MLEKLAEKLKEWAAGALTFDPSTIGDPLALKTDWSPLRRGGTNFRTHKLVRASPSRMEFRPTVTARVFSSVFLLGGPGFAVLLLAFILRDPNTPRSMALFPLVLGITFGAVGFYLLRSMGAPVVFDRNRGYFWSGQRDPRELSTEDRARKYADFQDIHALQLLSELIRGSKSSYYSFELNLVLKDGHRVFVVDHGNAKALREDARALSQFLQKPLWDGIPGAAGRDAT